MFRFAWIPAAILGYFIGNIQVAILLSRYVFKDDVRGHGSGNAGATNMTRVFGLGVGVITLIGDFLKALLAIFLGRLLGGDNGACAAGFAVVLGHDFPLLFGMKGGKGVACTIAVGLMTAPKLALFCILIGLGIIILSRIVSLGTLTGISVFAIVHLFFGWNDPVKTLVILALWALVLLRHRENIRRLLHGEEKKLDLGKKS